MLFLLCAAPANATDQAYMMFMPHDPSGEVPEWITDLLGGNVQGGDGGTNQVPGIWEGGFLIPSPLAGCEVCGDEGTGEIGIAVGGVLVFPQFRLIAVYGEVYEYQEVYVRPCGLIENEFGEFWDEQADNGQGGYGAWMPAGNHTNFDC
jgi:hypothetical protein